MWERIALTDVLDFREGPGILAKDFRGTGIPLIRLAGLKGHSVVEGCNFLDEADVLRRWSQFRLRLGDTLLSTSASLGEVATVDSAGVGAIPYTGIISFRPKDSRVAPEFIPLMLKEQSFKDQIEAMGVGSVMKHFGPSHLRHMSVTVPPRTEQQAIAEVLGALDDKIAANTALAATAESFSASIAATAPASVPLGSLAELSKQQLHPESLGDRFVDHFSLPAFDAGALPSTELASAIKSSKFVLTEESILLSKLNPRFPRVWRAAPASRPALASTEFLVLRSPEVTTRLLWASISDPTFAKALDARVAGTSGSHQRVKPADALTVKIRDPRALPERAQSLIEHVLRAASLAREESRTLAATRDALLPQLMSGKLRVRDAIRAAKEVV